MSQRLDQIKLQELGSNCQVVLFDLEGKVLESCETLLKTDKTVPIYQQFDFLLSLEEVIQSLDEKNPLLFDLVEWHEQRDALFGMKLEKTDAHTIQWFITDRSHEKEQILSIQQSRNDASINEELLEIRQKYLESEKKLLSYKNDELQRVQKFKERFFAEVSHEMRTPLNSISGLANALSQSKPAPNAEYLRALIATSEHLNHIINDVLDLSKVEEGKLQLEQLSFSLKEVTDVILKGFYMASEEKRITLKLNIDPAIPDFIISDPIRLSQVLYNLMGNAMKFTHKGGITLSIKLLKREKSNCTLRFEIKDTGIGMSEESLNKILEPYTQVEGQSHAEYGGTGLGMGIAIRLIEVLGGELKISSKIGIGTSMSFQLICSEAEAPNYSMDNSISTSKNIDLSKFKFLFAEDDAMSTMILKEHASRWKLNSHFVSDGKALEEALLKEPYDLLISDLHLGNTVSSEVIERLRQGNSLNKNIPIIFISGDNQEIHQELNALEGWSYLVKPVNPKNLYLKITETLLKEPEEELEPVDLTSLRAATLDNTEFLIELIDTILEHLPIDIAKLSEAVASDDFEAARKALHKMSPSIGYLGIDKLVEERKKLHDQVILQKAVTTDLERFKKRINKALKDLDTQKMGLIK